MSEELIENPQVQEFLKVINKAYSDFDEDKIKFSCKGIQKANNNICYKKFKDVLFNNVHDVAINQGFRYIGGVMKSYEQTKKGLSYVYCKRIVLDDGISTIPLNI